MLPAPTVTLMVLAGLRSAAALHVWGGAPIRSRALLMDASAPPAAPTLEFGDKRAERRRIMNEERYKRGAAPFDKEVHTQVVEKMSETFASELVEQMKDSTHREVSKGEGNAAVTFVLAEEFGFCWGVERSIELAWAARDAYPGKRMHITNELIHNPGVNKMLDDMEINFIEKEGGQNGGKAFEDVGDGDVVILPAFGASLDEMQLLDQKGATVVDTTCPWVSKVWTTVDKHAKMDMTSVIHGKVCVGGTFFPICGTPLSPYITACIGQSSNTNLNTRGAHTLAPTLAPTLASTLTHTLTHTLTIP